MQNCYYIILLTYYSTNSLDKNNNNVAELQQRLTDVWHGLQMNDIDSAVDELRKRLRACMCAQEHWRLLKHSLWI